MLLLLRYCVACQLLCCSMICWRLFIIFREYSHQACFAFLFQYFMILPLQNYRMTCFIKPPSILACDMTWLSSRSGWKTRRNLVLFILSIMHIASFVFEVSLKDTYHMICLPSLSLEGPIIARLLFCTWRAWDAWIVASGWFSDWHLVLSLTLRPVSDLCDLEQHLCGNPVLCFVPARIAQMFLDCS